MFCSAAACSEVGAGTTEHRPALAIVQLLVAQHDLDHADIDLLLQQVGGKAVTQRVHRDSLVDQRHVGGRTDGAVELAHGQRIHGVESWEQPSVGEDLPLGVGGAPPGALPLQQQGREHRVAVLAALALFDAQRHALAVDVGDLQADDLARAQAGAIGQRQRGMVLQVRDRSEQPSNLILAEHHGQGLRHSHGLNLGQQLAAAQRDLEEELQAGERGVDRDRRGALVDQLQLKTAQILSGRGVGCSLEKDGQAADRADIACLGSRLQLAHGMSSSMRWRSAETVGVRISMVLLLLKNEADCLARQQWTDISEHSTAQRRSVAARAA